MLQRFEKGVLHLYHCNGDSSAACYSRDMHVTKECKHKDRNSLDFPQNNFLLELLCHFSDGKPGGMKDY